MNDNTMSKNTNTMGSSPYMWVAVYADGSSLLQYEQVEESNKIVTHSFYDINQSKLDYFIVVSKEDVTRKYVLKFTPQMKKLIYYEDKYMNVKMDSRNPEVLDKGYAKTCVGYENEGEKIIVEIYPHGEIIINKMK